MFKLVLFCWVLLSGSTVLVASGSLLDAVPKCCGDYQVLDLKKQRCKYTKQNAYNFTTARDAQVYQPADSLPLQCLNGLATFNVSSDALNSDKVTVPGGNRTLGTGQFCIASSALKLTTVAYCKPINKCCPSGQGLHSSLRKCAPAQEAPPYERITRDGGTPLLFSHDASGFEYYVKFCVFQLSESSDGIEFDEDNGINIKEKFVNKTLNISYYCLDAVVEHSTDKSKMVAMLGNPVRQQNYFANVRKFFPHFCFVSSAFLFLTIIYYCTMAKLRKNLHGYAMICFLISMMIVQIDIGVAFSIARRTCVCAFVPYHRNFFRYASTTWTTVMGYMIWSQIRSVKPRSTDRENKVFTFAMYSLYAWGLPLVIVIAGITYDYLYPFVTACWWKSQHVKMFMDIPNITLQLLNNVFFVPSAMHICKSLAFLNEAVTKDANALKNQRKIAIVKMFAMMQSTKLAEILFSVRSLFDIQSDEYFMFVMCLYASVGPTLFFVLVDTSVIFRKCLVEVRNGFRMPFRNSSSVASLFKTAESFSLDPTSSDTTMTSTDSCVQPVRYLKRHVSSLEGPGESSAKDENNASKADNEPHTFG